MIDVLCRFSVDLANVVTERLPFLTLLELELLLLFLEPERLSPLLLLELDIGVFNPNVRMAK